MHEEWYLLSKPLYNSGFENDEFSAFAKEGFEEILESFLAENIEIYEKRLNITPLKTRVVVQGVSADTYSNSMVRQILARIGTLRCGQYVKAKNHYWLINGLPDNNGMYEKASAWFCKYSIRFISPISGQIVEYPVYDINSTQYGTGEGAETHMTVGTSKHLIYLPYNEETVMLDSGFRFLIDKNKEKPTAYKLAQVDTSSYAVGAEDGLLQWTVTESQFDETTDSREYMIADYYGKSEVGDTEPDTANEYVLALSTKDGKNTVIFGEETDVTVGIIRHGMETDPMPMTVTITDGQEYGSVKVVESGYFTIYALKNREYIGQEITVLVRIDSIDLENTIVLTVRGWY